VKGEHDLEANAQKVEALEAKVKELSVVLSKIQGLLLQEKKISCSSLDIIDSYPIRSKWLSVQSHLFNNVDLSCHDLPFR